MEIIKKKEKILKKTKAVMNVLLVLSLASTDFLMMTSHVEAAGESGNTYYVDGTIGNDTNSGNESKPFKTIQKAVDASQSGDTVIIREGVYAEEVNINKSGTAAAPITLKNYPGETVTISGCNPLSGWQEDENRPGEGIYKANMDWSLGISGEQNQLFADGKVMYEARYPNVDEASTMVRFNYAKAGSSTGFVSGTNKEKSQLVDPAFKEFATTADFFDGAKIWMVPGAQWTSLTSSVESYDPQSGKLVFESTERGKTNKWGYYDPKEGSPYFVYGTYTLLDAEMEWWYDAENQEIYIKAPNGENPDTAGVYIEAKKREAALNLSNSSYVNIEGINTRGATILIDENSSHILLKGIKGEYVGHNSDSDAQEDLGVLLKGSFIEVNSCEFSNSSGPVINVQGSDNSVINSYIHDGNYSGTYAGHAKLSGRRQFISNNTINESGRDVVSFRQLSESVIQYNDISGAGHLTLDVGVMYAADTDGQNTLIHHNYIHDNYTTSHNVGFYPDEMTHNLIVYNNVVYNADTAYQFNQPSLYNLAYNNTAYNTNIISDDYFASSVFGDSRGRQFINNMFNKSESNKYSPTSTFSKANINETNKFVDANNSDFRLQANSAGVNAGTPLQGVTPKGVQNPSAGAYQTGESLFNVGHNFENPPEIIAAPNVEQFEYRNRVKNGGFEYGTLESWDGTAEVAFEDAWHATDKKSATGWYGAVLNPGNSLSQSISVEPYTTYTLGLITRAPSSTGSISAKVSAGEESELTESVAAGKWGTDKRKFLTFTTGNTDEATIVISNTGNSLFYLDDVGVQKEIAFVEKLSKSVTLTPNAAGATVQFDELAQGHSYFYSITKEKDQSIKVGDIQTEKPAAYATELKSGAEIPCKTGKYLNIVETIGNTVVGVENIRYMGVTKKDIREAINDGQIRGGSYKNNVQNEGNTVYTIDLNTSNSADYTRKGYFQFDLADVDPDLLTKATLKFYIYATNSGEQADEGQGMEREIVVQGVRGEEWDEDTLTWANALEGEKPLEPTGEIGRVSGIRKLVEPRGKFCEIDITDYILQKANEGTKATVQLSPAAIYNQGNMYIATKENPTYADMQYHPQLILESIEEPEVELESISVTGPNKTEYMIGESLDLSGLVVTAHYDDGSEQELEAGSYEVSGFDSSTAKEVTVTVTYEGKTATFKVTVKKEETPLQLESISVTKPNKTEYLIGESLDLSGLVVTAHYDDGSKQELAAGSYEVSGFDSSTAKEVTVTVTYKGKTAAFKVTVKKEETPLQLESISVTGPNKTEYKIGESLDLSGLVVTAHYDDGSKQELAAGSYEVSGFDSSTAKEVTVTVTYKGKTAAFKVTVKKEETPDDSDKDEKPVLPGYVDHIVNSVNDVTVIGKFPEDVQLIVENIADNTEILAKITNKDAVKKFKFEKIFDIYMLRNGTVYSPNKNFTIKIKLDKELLTKHDLGIVYISDDGKAETIPSKVENGYITFTTTHNSYYAIVSSDSPIVNTATQPITVSSIPAFILLGAVLVFVTKKMEKVLEN